MCTQYVPIMRRRREGKTNYKKRKIAIMRKLPFVSVFFGRKNIFVQISSAQKEGDRTLVATHSRELIKYGWLGSRKNIPAAYLTGLLTGLKAKDKVEQTFLYIGLKRFQHNSRLTALIKGLLDAGVSIPADKEILNSEENIKGKHISDYANLLLSSDKAMYEKRFSGMISKGFNPQILPEHFEEVHSKIIENFKVKN